LVCFGDCGGETWVREKGTWLENRPRGSKEPNMVLNFAGLVGFGMFVYVKVYSYWYS
jgi:hypothetical protein